MIEGQYRQPLYDDHVGRIRLIVNAPENVIMHFYPDAGDDTPAWSWGFTTFDQWNEFLATVAAFDLRRQDAIGR